MAKGFTLIEILIVMGLVALITAVAIPSLTNVFRAGAESYARRTALLMRQARDRAFLTNKLVRMRVDIDKQEIWMEEASSSFLLPKLSERISDRSDRDDKIKKQDEAFQLSKELTREKQPVPKGIKITEVVSPRQKDPIKEGMADVYFFSNGNADGATIRFDSEEKTSQIVTLNPVTGQSRITAGGPPQ